MPAPLSRPVPGNLGLPPAVRAAPNETNLAGNRSRAGSAVRIVGRTRATSWRCPDCPDAVPTVQPFRVVLRATGDAGDRFCRLLASAYSFPPVTAARQARACFSVGDMLAGRE